MKIKPALAPVIILLIFLICPEFVIAQHSKCGTAVTPQQVAKAAGSSGGSAPTPQFAPNKCFGKTLSITAHIIADSLGGYSVSEAAVNAAVASLNPYWEPICISFQVCKFNYIPNYKYFRFLRPDEQAEILALYSVPNTINIFYPGTVEIAPGSTVGGYAALPGGPDIIVIAAGSVSSGVILHEMGHFFGLYHTFETSFGNELVNGSNCATAGDLVCDTPADPGLSNTPPPDCQLSPYTKDANNEWYVPHIGNIMSYYDCPCGLFTTGQYNRMADQYESLRFYLW